MINCYLMSIMFIFISFSAYSFAESQNNLNSQEMFQSQVLEKQVLKLHEYVHPKVREYVHPSDLFFTENGIYLSQDSHFVQITSIVTDGHGIYVEADYPSGKYNWLCPKCLWLNQKGTFTCINCGWSKGQPI